jgi:phenylalanyl-tRNA synthetase beta chain
MRIPLEWLRELVATDLAPAALGDRLTMAGLVCDGIEDVGRVDPLVVVGKLTAVEPHPQADRLSICRVDVGRELVVVSGAPDLRAGRRVPVAQVGAALANGTVVAPVELRGVPSEGMLCSEAELACRTTPRSCSSSRATRRSVRRSPTCPASWTRCSCST